MATVRREYRVRRYVPDGSWFAGYVRFVRWWGHSRWICITRNLKDSKEEAEADIDKYESEQPDCYLYTPKAPK